MLILRLGPWVLEIQLRHVSHVVLSGVRLLPTPFRGVSMRVPAGVHPRWARYELSRVAIGGARLGGR